MVVPHPVEQVFGADEFSVGAHEFGEHAELLMPERDRPECAVDLVSADVEVEVATP
jgi:hypothetical protein